MPKTNMYDMTGKLVGELELSDDIFGIEPDMAAIHAAVVNHLANRRQGTQSALTRAEVSGGGRKPWRQKGTGRARQGSTRSPQWTHGGVAFAPKPRSYSYRLNRKYRRLAMLSALSAKAQAGEIIVIENLDCEEIKTKQIASMLASVGAGGGKSLIVTPEVRRNVVLSARNIPGVLTSPADVINVYDIMNADRFIVDRGAVDKIQEVFGR